MKSVCCGAEIRDNGICKNCKEHAEAKREVQKRTSPLTSMLISKWQQEKLRLEDERELLYAVDEMQEEDAKSNYDYD